MNVLEPRSVKVRCVALLFLGLFSSAALALQTLEARDGVSVEAAISIKEPTRIRIEGAPITDVFGNIHSSNCGASPVAPTKAGTSASNINPAGEVVLECDRAKGEIYVKPVGKASKPINLFISSEFATYTLLLRRVDMPADTIVIRDRSQAHATGRQGGGQGHAANHLRRIKSMMASIVEDALTPDIRVQDVRQTIELWQEARFVLTRTYESRGLVGEKYVLTNISKSPMVLAEQEFDRPGAGVVAVSIENLNLRPGESTAVYVIRTEG